MVELILLVLAACAAALLLFCLPWILCGLVAIAPTVIAILIALWLFTALCG